MKPTFKYSLEGQATDRLIFRRLVESDLEFWMEFCKDDVSLKFMPFLSQLEDPVERCKLWFEKVFYRYDNNLGGMNVLVDKNTNEFIGQCGLMIHHIDGVDELEIGYSLMPAHRGKGYATEAAIKCKEFAFEYNYADSLISIVDVNNHLSAKVAMNNGMQIEKQTMFGNFVVNIFRINKV